jgi:hypothetical protein
VAEVVPAIHPYLGIDSLPALNHQKEFAAHCVGAAAERAIRDAATALAWTAIDVVTAAQAGSRSPPGRSRTPGPEGESIR